MHSTLVPAQPGGGVVDEEVVLLEEQLATAHADIERLEARLAEADRSIVEVTSLRSQLSAMQSESNERDARLKGLTAQIENLTGQIDNAREQSRTDAVRYRQLILAHEPDLPADLVAGETI